MAIRAFTNDGDTFPFVSEFDEGADKTVWHLRTLSSKEFGRCGFTTGGETGPQISVLVAICNLGIQRVDNFLDKDGQPIIFKPGNSTANLKKVQRIPVGFVMEIAGKILAESTLCKPGDEGDEDVKN